MSATPRPDGEVVSHHIDDHANHQAGRGDPEKRTMVDAFPRRTVGWVLGGVGSAMLLEFRITHGVLWGWGQRCVVAVTNYFGMAPEELAWSRRHSRTPA